MNDTPTRTEPKKTDEHEQKKEKWKSFVRIWITYLAAGFLFAACPLVAIILIFCGKCDDLGEKILFAIIPVSGSIIAYWFGGRGPSSARK